MGNCIISGKKKCKEKEVYVKQLSLEEPSSKNSTFKEELINNKENKDEVNLNNEDNNIINQNKIEEKTSNTFMEDDNKENENIDLDLTCNSNVYNNLEESSSISSLPSYHTPVGTPKFKIPNLFSEDRPIQPMPTPFRIDAVTPGRRIENLCDRNGRVRKDAPFQVYLAKKRKQNLFVH
ncbi:Hypothetical protein SRAE_1000314500 [Strongyloides ratti]|uniref:Uncharacterized protein n=1 Tax=Strongyloides ratti TaxID=34506 RepID=A0A090L590_STRRB|nr:Hypothetical protein SRAE_1000314500 [Strongyloides ratti]CEF64892.1 Hypothetical protein SRAE_1000314500 [Strongyloides ratti]